MKTFENSFVRGPSPSYSDEPSSENDLSITLPMATELYHKSDSSDYFNEKLHSVYEGGSYGHTFRQGRNTFAFWTVVIILLILTVGNLILTLTIIGVLKLGRGIQGMELIPEVDVIKFYGITDLDQVYTKNIGQIDGFADEPVTVTGDNGAVNVRVYKNGVLNDRIIIDKEGIVIKATQVFEVKDPADKMQIFTTHRPHYNIPSGVEVLISKAVSASRITSAIEQPLSLTSDGRIAIKGSEGINIDGGAVLIESEHHISVNSTQGATILEAGSGIFLDITKVPIVSSELGLRTGSVQFKLCVCMPQGTLFRIAIPRLHNGPKISCAHFSSKDDPCALN